MSNSSDIVIHIHQWRRPSCRLSKSSSPHSLSLGAMLLISLLLMISIKTEAHEMGKVSGYENGLPSLNHQHLTNSPWNSLDHKMTDYWMRTNDEMPTSTRALLFRLRDILPSSQLEAVTEISHLINLKSHLGIIQNYNNEQPSETSKVPESHLYTQQEETTPFTKIETVINEIRRRKKKGFSVISRLLVGNARESSRKAGGMQQRSNFLNENDSIQMRRSSALRPFRMRLRWG